MKRLAVLIATSGGAGYFPIAPGTVGSAVGVVVYLLMSRWSPATQVAIVCAIIAVGTWAADLASRHFAQEDPSYVVIDEVAGQLVTIVLTGAGIVGCIVGFFLFRILDIIKPWPAGRFERLPGGVGIMADDVMAGVYGWILLRLLIRIFGEF